MMYKLSLLITVIVITLIIPQTISAQVVINEVLPNPIGDDNGAEWVELYNLGNEPIPLFGCVLYLHESDNNQKIIFSDSDFIDKFEVISWDDKWLNNSGDKVRLICETFKDEVAYGDASGAIVGVPKEGVTIGRSPDGTGSFYILTSATLGSSNARPPTSTPPPTSIPTPLPTSTPSPTIVPTATSVPTRIPTPTPTREPRENQDPENYVLGTGDKKEDPETSKSDSDDRKKPIPFAAVIFIIAGLAMVAFPFINYLRLKKGYNSRNV